MRKTLLMVGTWDGATQLVNSAVADGWRVMHTRSYEDASEAVAELQPNMVFLCDSAAVARWGRNFERPAAPPPLESRTRHSGGNARAGIGAALEFIRSNHAENITLADAARAATYSPCHFSKAFKEQVGIGFIAYLTSVRMQHAKRLLVETDTTVTDVALAVGFGDLSHFERLFRRDQNETPSQFRARLRSRQYRAS